MGFLIQRVKVHLLGLNALQTAERVCVCVRASVPLRSVCVSGRHTVAPAAPIQTGGKDKRARVIIH